VDQLIIGTIMFMLALFLFPTIAAFYIHFVLMGLGFATVRVVLELLSILTVHFPIATFCAWLLASGSLGDGLYLRMGSTIAVHLASGT
jgi:hypothetical protein